MMTLYLMFRGLNTPTVCGYTDDSRLFPFHPRVARLYGLGFLTIGRDVIGGDGDVVDVDDSDFGAPAPGRAAGRITVMGESGKAGTSARTL